jgi:4-hydroxy-tetrahydrodipicolinate synthase
MTDIRGAISPLVTPFRADGSLDFESLRAIVEWQLERGSHGISVGGSTGEPTSLSVAERADLITATAKFVGGRVPFLAGTGTARLEETLELTETAQQAGATAAMIVTPYYTRAQQSGLYDWYARIAETFPDLPLIIYNVPVRAAVDISPETVAQLRRRYDNIVGIKESTRDFEHISHVLDLCGRDFIALSGIELLCYPMLALGGAGHLSCVANFAPEPVAQLYDAFVAGEHDRARELHYALHPLVAAAFTETNPVPVKWIMHAMGLLASPRVREPLTPLSPAGQERVRDLLAGTAHAVESVITGTDVRR